MLARSIGEQGWSRLGMTMFKTFMQYKCKTYGKHFIKIGRFEPSGEMCSACGATNHDHCLSDRPWTCKSCSNIHDRDINTAINRRDFGCGAAPLPANVEDLVSGKHGDWRADEGEQQVVGEGHSR